MITDRHSAPLSLLANCFDFSDVCSINALTKCHFAGQSYACASLKSTTTQETQGSRRTAGDAMRRVLMALQRPLHDAINVFHRQLFCLAPKPSCIVVCARAAG
jgi:hypothetical protein